MKRSASTSFPERVGGSSGRLWRAAVRLDRRTQSWLVARGWPAGVVKAMLWGARLAVLGLLLYFAFFWLALALLAICLSRGWVIPPGEPSATWEWRFGPFGYGLYDEEDFPVFMPFNDDYR